MENRIYKFNNQLGSRDRECKYAIINNDSIMDLCEAEQNKLCVVQRLNYTKNGKWSNSDLQVTVKSANLIVCMKPFNGWPDDLEMCIKHVKESCKNYIGYTPTDKEAELFFKTKYPVTYERIIEKEKIKSELI